MIRTLRNRIAIVIVVCIGLTGCGTRGVPRPYGYYRITPPDTGYVAYQNGPYGFDLSVNAVVKDHPEPGSNYWIDVYYPALDATVYCSYEPVRKNNLPVLTADALEFVYKHAGQAAAIPEKEFANPDARVYGVYFTLAGNTASPYQFFLTDSTRHFFRASVYCNCRPNADSLAPVFAYLEGDVMRMVESFHW